MNRSEFVNVLSKKVGFTKTDVNCLLSGALELIEESVSQGKDIKFVGFGTFDSLIKKSRVGRNPRTGVSVVIPETRVPRFRPGKDFKKLLESEKKSLESEEL